jgi:hypothetical protein
MKTVTRASRAFAKLNAKGVVTFGKGVQTGMTNNAACPNPPISMEVFGNSLNDLDQKQVASLNRGKLEIAARNDAYDVTLGQLRQLAAYVESVAPDLTTLLSTGFEAVNTNRTRIELPQPNVARLENGPSTQLFLRVDAVPSAKAYEVRMNNGAGGWVPAGIFTQARRILVENLTPGTVYTFQVRAIGGITGFSEWSDPVSRMSL